MPIDSPIFNLFNMNIIEVFKLGFLLLAILYFLFALIIVRQISLMTETVITEAGGILKVFSLLHAVFALAIVVLFLTQL